VGRELKGRHFLDLDQARTLPTPGLVATGRAVADLVEVSAMGVVHGAAGTGKTYAVETVLAGRADASVCWAAFPSRPTMRSVAVSLFETLSGLYAGDRTRFRLTDQLIELLAPDPGGSHRVLVVDEAQRLTRECIELLRHLHDHPATGFALVLVGGDGTWQVLSREPMLRSRVFRRVSLRPLTSSQVCELMGAFHPIYDGVEAELLALVDDNFAHGNLRDWASFTYTAAELCAGHGRDRLDAETARNALTLHGYFGG
jgi:DNA transposition AAA+ family ATPase